MEIVKQSRKQWIYFVKHKYFELRTLMLQMWKPTYIP